MLVSRSDGFAGMGKWGPAAAHTSDRVSAWESGTGLLAGVTASRNDPASIETDAATWLHALFPATFTSALAPYHEEFWSWLWPVGSEGPGPDGHNAFVIIWPRAAAKSTHVEIGCIALAAHSRRRYGWYVSGRQAQADDHLSTVSERITSGHVGKYYPELAAAKTQMVGDRTRQLGWRRRRIWTEDGFALDALGLDSAIRGAKLGDARPDCMIFDDIDEELDAEGTIERKIVALNRRIIPAGTDRGCIYIVAQNLVHPNGLVARLVDGRATYLGSRTLSGPHKAIDGLQYEGTGTEARILAGTPTWEHMSIEVCQQRIADAGIDSFLAELQHEVLQLGEPRFDRDALAIHALGVRDPLPAKALPEWAQDRWLSVWQLPIAGVSYALYFDGAEGVGSDYCATAVVRVDTKQLVALLHDNKREQAEHAAIAAELVRQYNDAFVGWERSHEADFASIMAAEGITRIYEHEEEATLAQRMNGTKPVTRRGYPARRRERRILVARLARYIERHEGALTSRVLVSEAQSFVKTPWQLDGEAGSGSHDDALFAFGGALLMSDRPEARRRSGERRPPPRVEYYEANTAVR